MISDASQHGMVEIMVVALWALLKLSVVILVEILLVHQDLVQANVSI